MRHFHYYSILLIELTVTNVLYNSHSPNFSHRLLPLSSFTAVTSKFSMGLWKRPSAKFLIGTNVQKVQTVEKDSSWEKTNQMLHTHAHMHMRTRVNAAAESKEEASQHRSVTNSIDLLYFSFLLLLRQGPEIWFNKVKIVISDERK